MSFAVVTGPGRKRPNPRSGQTPGPDPGQTKNKSPATRGFRFYCSYFKFFIFLKSFFICPQARFLIALWPHFTSDPKSLVQRVLGRVSVKASPCRSLASPFLSGWVLLCKGNARLINLIIFIQLAITLKERHMNIVKIADASSTWDSRLCKKT